MDLAVCHGLYLIKSQGTSNTELTIPSSTVEVVQYSEPLGLTPSRYWPVGSISTGPSSGDGNIGLVPSGSEDNTITRHRDGHPFSISLRVNVHVYIYVYK